MRVDPQYGARLTQAIGSAQAQEQTLTTELSSGLRVSSLSADPLAAAANVRMAHSISRIDTFVQSAATVQSRMQVTDTTLGDVVSQVTAALSLAVSAGNGSLSQANLSAIAAQVAGIRDNVLTNANATYLGEYLFSGSKGTTKPFTLDASTTPGIVTYHGDAVAQTINTPTGQSLQVNVPGAQVFSAGGADLLGTLNQLVSDLQSGSTSGIATETAALTTALGNVTTQRAGLDSQLKRLTDSTSYADTQEAALKAAQAAAIAADPAQVATQLKSTEVQYQALLGVAAVLNKENLFDFLR